MFYSDIHVNNKLAVSEAPLNADFCLLIDGDKQYILNKTQRKQLEWAGVGLLREEESL